MIYRFGLFLSALLLICLAPLASADAQPLKVDGRLVAERGEITPGGKVTVALAMTPRPGWHGYWKNGGDAGFGMIVDWVLPAGMEASPGRYPVPHTFMLEGLMNHVYERPYAILFDLSVPEQARPGTRLPIVAKARWLACSDTICLPQQGRFSLTLNVGGKAGSESDPRFAEWRAKLPAQLAEAAYYEIEGGRLRLALPYPASAPLGEDAHFFAESEDMVDYAAEQRFGRAGDLLIVETGAAPGAAANSALTGVIAIAPDRGLSIRAQPSAVPPIARTGSSLDAAGGPVGLALTFVAALLGGLLLNIMPCVFPILGLKAISLAKAGGDEREARREALGYTAGAVGMALALGGLLLGLRAAGEEIGWAFQLQNPAVVFFLLMLMSAVTANLLGLFELPGGNFAEATSGRSSIATGALAAFVATPCTGPFMAAALGTALLLPWAAALLLFFALGLGLALPFLAIGFSPAMRRMLPRPGPWLGHFRRWMALPMGLTVLALLWLWLRVSANAWLMLVWPALLVLLLALTGREQRQGRGARFLFLITLVALVLPPLLIASLPDVTAGDGERAQGTSGDIAFSRAALERLRAAHEPVFLYFTADWCITCKANEAAALDRASVRAAFERAGIVAMRGDFTRPDPEIAEFLTAHGRAGVPLYLFYPPGGDAVELPQILTPGRLIALAKDPD